MRGWPGKTFLACWVTTKAKERGRTIYAFPSPAHADTTALSIMHSLLFQLASSDTDLQAVLTESNKRDMMSSINAAKGLFADLLRCAGDTFLVIDGLDEIEEFERKQLLSSLVEILDACAESSLKICISSRAEDDITKILEPRAATVRVEKENARGILTYIDRRYDEWMASSDFLVEGRSEIKSLLHRICAKAEGTCIFPSEKPTRSSTN